MSDIPRNILLGIMLAAPIGPASLAVIQNGLRQGFLRAFLTGVGIISADATYLLIVFFGLASFINLSWIKALIWIFGTLVLLYLGIQSIRDGSRKLEFESGQAAVARNPWLVGYLINISNPLAIVFWLGIFGSLLGTTFTGSTRLEALLSSASILVGIFLWHSTMSFVSHWGRNLLNQKTVKVVSTIAGIALILFALRFGYNAALVLFPGLGT